MKRRILKNMEWSVLVCSILLLCIGMVALYSASQQTEYEEAKKTNNVGNNFNSSYNYCNFYRL